MVQARDHQGLVPAVQDLDHQARDRMVQAVPDHQALVQAVPDLDHRALGQAVQDLDHQALGQAVQDLDHQVLRRRSRVRPFLLTLRLSRGFRPWATGSQNTILEPTVPRRATWR